MHVQKTSFCLLKFKNWTLDIACILHLQIASFVIILKSLYFRLDGNPLCSNETLGQFCRSEGVNDTNGLFPANSSDSCRAQSCPPPYEYSVDCFCAAPLLVGYRLKSPGFSDFRPYLNAFEKYLTSGLSIYTKQLNFTFQWQSGPRLRMNLKIFPLYVDRNSSHTFNRSEVQRIRSMFTGWKIPDSDLFGPYELNNFILLDPYKDGKSHELLMIC